jgi:ParB family chromosome partitioning protein
MLQILKVSDCYESETNPRGKEFAGKQFDELVASIKEKGVLVPVLARLNPSKASEGKNAGCRYEVVAGNRRLRAAKTAGLVEIPAQVQEMTDAEAQEAQIVENLQRADVHPLEEGEAYRRLLIERKKAVSDIAIAVGKSESYVRDRLFLTNLVPAAQKVYRSGTILDGHAVLIAKLSEKDQAEALKYTADEWNRPTVAELKEWIERVFYSPMERQPWVKAKALGDVRHLKACQPNGSALFGEAKMGACTDLDCWKAHMTAWVALRMEKVEGIVMISSSYRSETKGALDNGKWQPATGKKNECKLSVPAIFVEGVEIGKETMVCANSECKKHWGNRQPSGIRKLTPEEKEARKKMKEEEAKREERAQKDLAAALGRVKWPMSEAHLGAMLDVVLSDADLEVCKKACERRHIAVEKESNGMTTWYDDGLKKAVKKMTNDERLQLVFEILIGGNVFSLDLPKVYKSL